MSAERAPLLNTRQEPRPEPPRNHPETFQNPQNPQNPQKPQNHA